MRITALLHILSMANLVGLLFPLIVLTKEYRRSANNDVRASIGAAVSRIAKAAYVIVLLVVLTGVGRVAEGQYAWFAFGSTFWLAMKQTVGLLMTIFVLATWLPLRRAANSLRAQAAASHDVDRERTFGKISGWVHMLVGAAWLLLVLGVLKP